MTNQQPADLRLQVFSTLADQAAFNTAQLEDGVLSFVKETGVISFFNKLTGAWSATLPGEAPDLQAVLDAGAIATGIEGILVGAEDAGFQFNTFQMLVGDLFGLSVSGISFVQLENSAILVTTGLSITDGGDIDITTDSFDVTCTDASFALSGDILIESSAGNIGIVSDAAEIAIITGGNAEAAIRMQSGVIKLFNAPGSGGVRIDNTTPVIAVWPVDTPAAGEALRCQSIGGGIAVLHWAV